MKVHLTPHLYKLRQKLRKLVCPFDDLLKLVPMESTIFDIGCGTGFFLQLIAQSRMPKRLDGSEPNSNAIAIAKNSLSEGVVPYHLYETSSIPESIDNYDFISMIDVLHHIPRSQQDAFLKTLITRAAAGTYILIKDINLESYFFARYNRMHDLIFSGNGFQERSMGELENFLSEYPITFVEKRKKHRIMYPHFWFLIRKK